MCLFCMMLLHALCRLVLQGPLFQQYFEKVEVSNFEVASDAFSTFKVPAKIPVRVTMQIHVIVKTQLL